MARGVFPLNAVFIQKRYMRRFVHKTREVSIKEFVARQNKLNNYLTSFPKEDDEDDDIEALPEDELMEILEFGVPNSWQNKMVQQNFNISVAT